eukprot:CCRYP_003421-RB/>CCRYP_003421-RB protein AED:0.29 eAED:0.29 QI:384/1/1/1/1/1/3/1153/1159
MAYAEQSGSTVHNGYSSDSSRPRRTLPSNFPKHDPHNPHIHDNERRDNERRPNRDLHSDFDDEAFDEEDLPPPAPPSPNSLDDERNTAGGEAKDDTFDTLEDFGEDTLHALMESDIVLGGMPPLASLRSRDGNHFKIQEEDPPHDDDDHDESMEQGEFDDNGDEMKREQINADEFTMDDEDDGTMASSFLRGPLMAAKSFAAMNLDASRVNIATTPSTARAHFLMSAMKPSLDSRLTIDDTATMAPHDNFQKQKSDATPHSNAQLTPSTARSSFLSTKKESFKSSSSIPPTATPSNFVISTHKPPLGQRNGVARTPSAQRGDFITSPQDSVSTMGSAQSMDHVVYRQNTVPLTVEERGNTPSGERQKFLNSPQDSLTSHGTGRVFTFRHPESCEEHAATNMDLGDFTTTPHSNKSASEQSNPKSSVDRLIALGEEQMKQAASTSAANSTAKQSFLRKGSRKEPSALHTIDVAQPTAAVTTTSNVTSSNESASERKARIARLEKMQEDLQRDYERREARKEEAQRERRRSTLTEMGSRGVVTQSTLDKMRGINHGEEIMTPSQARARSVSQGQMLDVGKNNPTPSKARARSAVRPGRHMTSATPKSTAAKDAPTPMRARSALKSKRDENNTSSCPQVRIDTNHTAHVRYEDGVVDNGSVEETKDDDMQSNANEKALPVESTTSAAPAPVAERRPNEQSIKTTSSQRRPRSASRPQTTQSKPAARSPSPKRSNVKDTKSNDEMAFEDWKRREGEEWALIKNMRKRQEAALREAEGERERAKAWALAEIESTKKWVEEQRALIKKDRHKAANAALLATKKAERIKSTNESNAINAELVELRSQIQKMKLEAEEAKKLKEQVRKQEKTILALKGQRGGVTSPKRVDEETNDRRVFKDCTSSQTNKLQSKSTKPKTLQNTSPKECLVQQVRKKPASIIHLDKSNDGYSIEEESADGCLEPNSSDLRSASNENEPGMQKNNDVKATAPVSTGPSTAMNHVQRKPYNAADYDPTREKSPTFAPVQSVSPVVPHVNANAASAGTPKTSQFFTYQNGTRKEVLSDGTTTVYFTNGDRKRTYANEKKGIVVYYYAATQTTQVTHQDGKQTYHFPNKQIEDHHVDGTKEIVYPDGTKRTIFTDGTTDTTFPDGVRVVDYPDGTQRVHQAS